MTFQKTIVWEVGGEMKEEQRRKLHVSDLTEPRLPERELVPIVSGHLKQWEGSQCLFACLIYKDKPSISL